jgi:hypothetical protein
LLVTGHFEAAYRALKLRAGGVEFLLQLGDAQQVLRPAGAPRLLCGPGLVDEADLQQLLTVARHGLNFNAKRYRLALDVRSPRPTRNTRQEAARLFHSPHADTPIGGLQYGHRRVVRNQFHYQAFVVRVEVLDQDIAHPRRSGQRINKFAPSVEAASRRAYIYDGEVDGSLMGRANRHRKLRACAPTRFREANV